MTLLLIADYRVHFALCDRRSGVLRDLVDVDWADWDQRGRLVFTRGCTLLAADDPDNLAGARLIGDFGDQRFTPIVAPDWATHW